MRYHFISSSSSKEGILLSPISSHFSPPYLCVYGKWGTLALLLLFVVILGTSTAAAQAARVSVTINSVNNKACIDQKFGFCGKSDMMVRVALLESDGTLKFCPDTVPIINFD